LPINGSYDTSSDAIADTRREAVVLLEAMLFGIDADDSDVVESDATTIDVPPLVRGLFVVVVVAADDDDDDSDDGGEVLLFINGEPSVDSARGFGTDVMMAVDE
jgi:hypothetical protein